VVSGGGGGSIKSDGQLVLVSVVRR